MRQHQTELEKAYANLLEEIEGLKEKGIHVDEDSDLGIGLEELENGHIDAISMSVVVDELNKLRKENNIEPSRITVPPYPATSDIREGEYKDDLKKRIRSGMTQTAALESIRDNTQNSFYKILANRLLKVGLTGDIGYSEKIETENIFSESASGQYNKDTDNVTISKTGLGRRNIEHVILHELIHAATINSLPNTLFSLDKKSTEYKLNQLYHFLHDNHPDISDHYGLKSPFELLAEGFTNPDFQNLLKKVPYQSDTAWSQFVDMVMELLGLSKDNRTALDEVMNLGEQVISEETGRRKLSGKGSTAKVAVPKSDIELEVQYKVVENTDLVASHNIEGNENPDYPSELQPRDRTRQGSKEQIVKLAGRFNPALATANPLSSDGAPIINASDQVESGNGRTLALRNVYGSKPKLAEQYKQYLIDHASEFGLDPAVIEAMDQPQLVRERKTELTEQQLQEYLKKSNDPDMAKSSVTEQAFNDAKVIDDQMIQLFNPGSDGSLDTAGNRNFLDKFYQAIGGDANSLRTKDGEAYTKQFYERLQGALFAKAYGDQSLVSLALEENTEGVTNVIKALNVSAPDFARVKAKHGDLADLNLVAPMVDGIRVYREAKANNQAIDEYISQGDMLSGDSVPHLTGLFAQMIDANERRHKQMGVAFAELARDIGKELDLRAEGNSLLGPHQKQSLSDILNASNRLVREQNEQIKTAGGQSGLFSAGGKPTQTAESQESGRPAKTSSVEDKQRQEEGGKAKTSAKKKLTKPTATKMSQYRENEQQRNHLVSGKADKKYFDRGTDRSAGGLTAAGQKKYDKLQDANDKIYGQIVKAAQQFPSEESWLKAVEAAGHDPDSWSWSELDIEPESSNNDQIAEQPAPVPMADFGEMEVPDVNKLRENNPEAAAAIAKEAKKEQPKSKRQRRMVEIDSELDDLGAEMAAIFKEQAGRLSSGLDPVIAGKMMIIGVKTGAKLVEKGALKFADWADNMLGLFERHGVSDKDAAPYLKRVYLATKAEVSDEHFEQMDGERDVRAFDIDTLLEEEEEVSQEQALTPEMQSMVDHLRERGAPEKDINEIVENAEWSGSHLKDNRTGHTIKTVGKNTTLKYAKEWFDKQPQTEPITKEEAPPPDKLQYPDRVKEVQNYKASLKQLALFFKGLPASTLDNASALVRAFNKSEHAARFLFSRDSNKRLFLEDKLTKRNFYPPRSTPTGYEHQAIIQKLIAYTTSDQQVEDSVLPEYKFDRDSDKYAEQSLDKTTSESINEFSDKLHEFDPKAFVQQVAPTVDQLQPEQLENLYLDVAAGEPYQLLDHYLRQQRPDLEKEIDQATNTLKTSRLKSFFNGYGDGSERTKRLGHFPSEMADTGTPHMKVMPPEKLWPNGRPMNFAVWFNPRNDTFSLTHASGDPVGVLKNIEYIQYPINDIIKAEAQSASSTDKRVESDSQSGKTGEQSQPGTVQDESGPAGTDAGSGIRQSGQAGLYGRGDRSVSESGTHADGKSGDQSVHREEQQTGPKIGSTGSAVSGRSNKSDADGVQPDRPSNQSTPVATQSTVLSLEERQKLQKEAENIPVTAADLANIRETLPMLLPDQQEDVEFIEKRFYEKDGRGAILTNGTGTGKTFSGMGIVKRFVKEGKDNILIITPSQGINSEWIKAGNIMGVDMSVLPDTKSNGEGPVVTTYNNLASNPSLANREWDLIVTDESHNLKETDDMEASQRLTSYRAITGHPSGRYQRAMMRYPDYEPRIKELSETIGSYNKSDNAQLWAKVPALEKELATVRAEWREKSSEVYEEADQLWASKNTRSLMLSATPFAHRKTVDYANGYLFDYPTEDIQQGYYKQDGRDQFFINNFGYRYRYGKLTEPDTDVDTGLMERNFNQNLRKEGVMRSRTLEVPRDYDRKFVLVEGGVGAQVDTGIQWVEEQYKEAVKANKQDEAVDWNAVKTVIDKKFNYISRAYLLESVKAKASVDFIKENLALGRKMVVFHDYNKGGSVHPFRWTEEMKEIAGDAGVDVRIAERGFQTLAKMRPDLANLPLDNLDSPRETLTKAFGDQLLL